MAFQIKFLIFGCLTVLAQNESNDNLVAVVQVFRHGQRTPILFSKTDLYQDRSYWDGLKPGELTNEGKRQQFNLGQFTRNRYKDWLSQGYDNDEFIAFTTNIDRTHMSGQCNTHGLFLATDKTVWRPGSDWQPIPLHTVKNNVLYSLPDVSCKNYYVELAEAVFNPEFAAINEENADVYKYLTEHSGENVTSFFSSFLIWDTFKIEEEIGFTLPEWAKSVYPEPLTRLASYTYKSYTSTVALKRLGVGPFLHKIISYFKGMAENSTFSQKFHMYSGHDTNIAAILNIFDAFDPPYTPEFASTIYLELRVKSDEHYINAWSKDKDDIKQVSVRGCDLDCPLSEFISRLKYITIDTNTYSNECISNIPFTSVSSQTLFAELISGNGIGRCLQLLSR